MLVWVRGVTVERERSACEQSVAAEPSRRVDRLEFGEVEFADRAERLGGGGVLERVGQGFVDQAMTMNPLAKMGIPNLAKS